jgi:putative transposase
MKKPSQETSNRKVSIETGLDIGQPLEVLIRQGARQMLCQAVEAELQIFLSSYENVTTTDGRPVVVRNGYQPERDILTAAGPVPIRIPKVRDRSGSHIKFNSRLVPPYVRRSAAVSVALPWLYLKGLSTGDMSEALQVLLGEEAKGLSPPVVSRLKMQWAEEKKAWDKRDLSAEQYVYWWADGVYTELRNDDAGKQCLLVIIGVKPDGRKERVALGAGFRESSGVSSRGENTRFWRTVAVERRSAKNDPR